jgi:hypothetical protein
MPVDWIETGKDANWIGNAGLAAADQIGESSENQMILKISA